MRAGSARPGEAIRRRDRRRRRILRGRRGRGGRPARPQRGGQDDHRVDDLRPGPARRGPAPATAARSGGDADPRKRQLGLVPQELALVEELTARRQPPLLRRPSRTSAADPPPGGRSRPRPGRPGSPGRRPVRTFSGGMKRRLNLAAALLHDPDLIVLDEPTVGRRPPEPQRRSSRASRRSRPGASRILYATHYMEEAERLCDRVVISTAAGSSPTPRSPTCPGRPVGGPGSRSTSATTTRPPGWPAPGRSPASSPPNARGPA